MMLVFLTGLLATLALQAAPVAIDQPPEPAPEIAQGGKIVIYRGSSVAGAAVACPVRYKGIEIVELGRGKYAQWEVAPGRYILNNKTSSIELTVEPGETRYVRCMIKTGLMIGRADLQVVDAESFEKNGASYKRKDVAFQFAKQP